MEKRTVNKSHNSMHDVINGQNHIHVCEIQLIQKCKPEQYCNFGIRRKYMGHKDVCDACHHLRIMQLSDDGLKIINIE